MLKIAKHVLYNSKITIPTTNTAFSLESSCFHTVLGQQIHRNSDETNVAIGT